MKTITIDGSKMKSKCETHEYLKNMLNFPEYYGNNLDALWDIISTVSEPIIIELINSELIEKNLGLYGTSIIEIFREASLNNENIVFKIT